MSLRNNIFMKVFILDTSEEKSRFIYSTLSKKSSVKESALLYCINATILLVTMAWIFKFCPKIEWHFCLLKNLIQMYQNFQRNKYIFHLCRYHIKWKKVSLVFGWKFENLGHSVWCLLGHREPLRAWKMEFFCSLWMWAFLSR